MDCCARDALLSVRYLEGKTLLGPVKITRGRVILIVLLECFLVSNGRNQKPFEEKRSD